MNSTELKILESLHEEDRKKREEEIRKKEAALKASIDLSNIPGPTLEDIANKISSLGENDLFDDDNFRMIFDLESQIDRQRATALYREKAKSFKKAKSFDELLKAYRVKEQEAEKQRQALEQQKKKAHLVEIGHNFPLWVADGKINEVIFCREYSKTHNMKCINGQFYNIDGLINEDKVKNIIQRMIDPYINRQLSKTTEALFKALKNSCYHETPTPSNKEIHLKNGILKTDGTFIQEKVFCLNRLNVNYADHYNPPATWCKFLNDLLHEEDILTLQEFLGYCLIPSTRAQVMLFLIGEGGEGKSQIGAILKELFTISAESGSLPDLENNKYTMATIENKLLFIDDDLSTDGLKDTKNIKRIVTAMGKIQIDQKYQPIREANIYARLLTFGNTPLKALYDVSEGFFRRQIVMNVKPKPENRVDDKNLIDKMLLEKDMIFLWMFDGLQRLIMNGYQFTISEQTRKNMEEIREDACNVISFLKDASFVVYGPYYELTSRDIYDLYNHWCEANAERPLAQKTMLNYLKTNAKKLGIKPSVFRNWEKRQVRGFRGIGDVHKINGPPPD